VAIAAVVITAAAPPTAASSKAGPSEEQRVAQAVERALQKQGPEVHRCFEKALADRLDVAGKVEVQVTVGGAGKVTRARVLSQGHEVPLTLASCVQSCASAWVIDGIEAGADLVLPFAFEAQMNQFVVKAADVPERGPPAPKNKGGGPKVQAPFTVKVLADGVNVRSQQASLTLLTVGPASRVAMHRHPHSAKALYLVKGHARLIGPAGAAPLKVDEGMAVFVPPGYPHVIENMGRQTDAVFLQAFSPPGPERVYRDPADPQGRAEFEVIRDAASAKAPADGAQPVVVAADKVPALKGPGGKGSVRILLDQKATGSPALALSLLEFPPGAEVPRHAHAGTSELLYIVSGGGQVTVGNETMPFEAESAIFIPPDQPHASKAGPDEPTLAVQIYAPAGPEQRFRNPAPGAPPAPKK
jgi:quercetin dioxygenase-like cupin family protein